MSRDLEESYGASSHALPHSSSKQLTYLPCGECPSLILSGAVSSRYPPLYFGNMKSES